MIFTKEGYMKRNTRIIQINGIRGMLMALFTVICLAAGFIVFPGYVAKSIWNYFAGFSYMPEIHLFQGVLLWAIVVLSYFILNNKQKHSFIALKSPKELNDEELKQVMNAIKMQTRMRSQTPMIIKANELQKFELKEIKTQDLGNKSEEKSLQEEKEKEKKKKSY